MDWLKAIILGILQGVAEFLPISSSGHLSIAQHFMGITEGPLFFSVMLHFATFFSICLVFRKTVWGLICEFFKLIGDIFTGKFSWKKASSMRRMLIYIIIATLPLFAFVPFNDAVESLSTNMYVIGAMLLLTAVLLKTSDIASRRKLRPAEKVTPLDSIIIGFGQAFAIMPGLSRSGTTISTGLFLGIDREYVADFSFLMSLPAVAGSTILTLKDAAEEGIAFHWEYLLGMAVAFVVGIFAIKLVKLLVKSSKFGWFAYYCAAAGIATIAAEALIG